MNTPLADLRIDYGLRGLAPEDCLADPMAQLRRWLDEAIAADVPEPTAMALATVTAEGRPASRIVLLKGVEDGLCHFYTNYASRKGGELAGNGFAALTFFWPALERQIRIEGRVSKLPEAVSDAYFASRPLGSRLGAWVSEQSQPLDDPATLSARYEALQARYGDQVPRPPHWGGYGLAPDRLEFWQGRPSRLHDRVIYVPDGDGWARSRLQP